MKKLKKAIQVALLCLLCLCIPCMLSGTTVSAKAKQVTYTPKNNVCSRGSGKMKGQTTMTHTLKVKESGTVFFRAWPEIKLSKNQEVRMKVIDSKGKTVISQKLSGTIHDPDDECDYTCCEKYLKKGTYKIVFTTKNIKKTKAFTVSLEILLRNKPAYANAKYENFFINNKGKATITLKNEKSQLVYINGYAQDSGIEMTVTDKQGNRIFKESASAEDIMGFNSHFLKKGTYYITIEIKRKESKLGFIKITPNTKMTAKLQKEATSWEKAIDYKNKELYLTYFDWSGAAKKQWLRLDTSDGDKSFRVAPVGGYFGEAQSITNPKIKVSLYDQKGKLVKTGGNTMYLDDEDVLRTTDLFSLKKDTGVYYVAIEASSSEVVRVFEK